jgi:ATP-dependent helicase/nuclease subunit B
VLAGAEAQFLPRHANQSPFFNDSVRATLKVPTQRQKQALGYYHFRRLLLSVPYNNPASPTILVTRRARDNDEDIIPSLWIAALQSFHQLAYGSDLSNHLLGDLTGNSNSHVQHDHAPLPRPAAPSPRPTIPAPLIPATISASAYQQLVDCPYQFFAARCLRLAPPDTVKEALQKSDYGEKIHQCLEAFHSDLPDLPGPFTATITPKNRDQAEKLLNDIATTVFAREVEDNFMHRGWLKRWQTIIPRYVDWQIHQQQHGALHATEIKIRQARLDKRVIISGRIDRIDTGDQRLSVIDYKTGAIPAADEVLSGEAVQLPFYLLLLMTESVDDTISSLLQQDCNIQAMYVDVGDVNKVQSRATMENTALNQLVHGNRKRLLEITEQISNGKPLPAWGDNNTCNYCPMDGLCRKQTWEK